ncbi:unnamed protein product [Lactuca virosa]|uniref:JAB1/MPN/MOV34 metalloenzyme domain-containing protein n=1 Tax=Lactuca virosa TaxID=75947 RepID=A0AAU9NEU1_9ASTR|nr:unnamed protein product [Lactuca virosa]
MASSSSGLTFELHPLVIVNISDHHTRVKSQSQPPTANGGDVTSASSSSPALPSSRVFGCVIGVQRGPTIEIFNSFELLYDPSNYSLDRSFLEKKQELYKKVFPKSCFFNTGPAQNVSLYISISHCIPFIYLLPTPLPPPP